MEFPWGEANFGGFIKPGESFENLDKKKFYLCTEQGQYANGFSLYNHRTGILKWDTNTNKWFILAKRNGYGNLPSRSYVNKAIRLTDLRIGDTYYFFGIMWVLGGIYYNAGGKQRYQTYIYTNGSFCVTVSEEMISEMQPYVGTGDMNALHAAARIIADKYMSDIPLGVILTESPFAKIIDRVIVRTHVCDTANLEVDIKDGGYHAILRMGNACFLQYVKKTNGKEKQTINPNTNDVSIRHHKVRRYLKKLNTYIDLHKHQCYIKKRSRLRQSFGKIYYHECVSMIRYDVVEDGVNIRFNPIQ